MADYIETGNGEVAKVEHLINGTYAVNEYGTVVGEVQQGSGGWEMVDPLSSTSSGYSGSSSSSASYNNTSYSSSSSSPQSSHNPTSLLVLLIAWPILLPMMIIRALFSSSNKSSGGRSHSSANKSKSMIALIGSLFNVVNSFFSFLNLILRIFMHPDVAAWHCKQASKFSIQTGALFLTLTIGGMALVYFGGEGDISVDELINESMPFLIISVGILGMAIIAQILRLIHGFIAMLYPSKVRGNGYGLLNIIALLPLIRPSRLLTLLPEVGVIIAYIAFSVSELSQNEAVKELVENGRFSLAHPAVELIIIYTLPLLVYLFLIDRLLWSHDRKFANVSQSAKRRTA